MQRSDWLICQSASKFVERQIVSLMKNEQQSQNLLHKVDPRSVFRNNFLQPATNVFVARQVDNARWKTRNTDRNLQQNNVARQVEGFCISYFAAFTYRPAAHVLIWQGIMGVVQLTRAGKSKHRGFFCEYLCKWKFKVHPQADHSMCSCLYEMKRIYEGYEENFENCTSNSHLGLNIPINLNETIQESIKIDFCMVFFALMGRLKRLIAGEAICSCS